MFCFGFCNSFGLLIGFILAVALDTIRAMISVYIDVIGWIHYLSDEFWGVLGMNTKSIVEAYKGDAIDETFGNLLKSIKTRVKPMRIKGC